MLLHVSISRWLSICLREYKVCNSFYLFSCRYFPRIISPIEIVFAASWNASFFFFILVAKQRMAMIRDCYGEWLKREFGQGS